MAANLRAVPARPLSAVAYIRVSKERDDMISPELQETAIRDHCARSGFVLGEIITDLDLSGRFWKRRQMERAIAQVEAGDVDVIVVWKVSRVSRNRLDWEIALDRIETAGGRLESATEPIDATTSSGRFSRGILAGMAAFESERAGEQWQETHRRRWRNGLPHNGKPRFGYSYDRATGYTPDPELAPIAAELYRRYVAGAGLVTLVDYLATLGVTALTTARGVAYYLRTGFAAGLLVHHDPACPLTHRSGKRCPNTIMQPGIQAPIIDAELWAAFQQRSGERATLPARLVSPVSALSGIVLCGSCGYRMSLKSPGSRSGTPTEQPYYRCARRECPRPMTYRRGNAERLVLEWLPTVAEAVTREARAVPKRSASAKVERERLDRVISNAATALQNLTVDHARRIIPEAAYLAARDTLTAEQGAAQAALDRFATSAADGRERAALASGLLDAWPAATDAERNAIARELCRVVVSRTDGDKRPTGRVFGVWEVPDIPQQSQASPSTQRV
ncbi:recombinase family protein [Cryobacterium sp. 10C2]|uniref:recombinase family protein n=1 Tax=Cryobacterium sp. 10C2 TaxID=3048576 RepID=UPI002AB58B59|nr:recombinase family protein [Cryobacterium sp. 10C2]MDY7528485.1 recombinase family protein [Cryobacterium sp. 10C2]MEB0289205.1 recombinase family protein [Cryobacterium sp. 10C2]